MIAKYRLHIRENYGNTVALGSREDGIDCVINKDATIIQFAQGDLKPIELGKPYRLSKQSPNHYLILGTGYRIEKNQSIIHLIK